jgi:hypothetical protein
MKTTKHTANHVSIEQDGVEWTAQTSCRIEWRRDGQLVKRERVPEQVRVCALSACDVMNDETTVG